MSLHRIGIAVCMMIMAGLISPGISHSQESTGRAVKYVRGRVSGINYVGSRVTVKWLSAVDNPKQKEMTFFLPSDARISSDKDKIFDNARSVGIVDLVIGNHVIISYYDNKDKASPFEAISIKILDQDRPISP